MLNNLEVILPLLEFKEGSFYYIHIIRRRKENKDLPVNAKIIKEYVIRNEGYLRARMSEIELMCKTFNARAMISLNRCSDEKVCLHMLKTMIGQIEGSTYSGFTAFRSAAAKAKTCGPKYWLWDIDENYLGQLDYFIDDVNKIEPLDTVFATIPSKTGVHVITKGFNRSKLPINYKTNIDMNTTPFTNLYIP